MITILAKSMRVLQTSSFSKTVKKLKPNQKQDLDAAIRVLIEDPALGEQKKGDLSFLRVHKFKMNKQLTLLGYSIDDGALLLELIVVGSYERFYRDVNQRM